MTFTLKIEYLSPITSADLDLKPPVPADYPHQGDKTLLPSP